MKTTIDIADALFDQARAQAKARGVTLRALVESGLRMVLAQSKPASQRFEMRDFSFGTPSPQGDLEKHSDPSKWRDVANPEWTMKDGRLVRVSPLDAHP
jgi:hypothetical protein